MEKISKECPPHLDKTAFINDLLFRALDRAYTLSGPPGRYSYSSSNSLEGLESVRGRETFLAPISENFVCHSAKAFSSEQKKTLSDDTPAFKAFWEIYQTAPTKASNQSKSKARASWKTALKTEKAERLIEATKRAVKDQVDKVSQDEWVAPLPDAYRWLRDECFTVWLEDHASAQPQRVVPGETIL